MKVRISSKAILTECDLITIGDSTAIDTRVIISPFCVDAGAMMLSAIEIGASCGIGSKTTIAPGAKLSDGICLGPLTSSHEQHDASEKNWSYCRASFPSPPCSLYLVLGLPALLFVQASGVGWTRKCPAVNLPMDGMRLCAV